MRQRRSSNILFVTDLSADEPLGIMQLSSMLKKSGHNVRGVVLGENEDAQHVLKKIVKEFRPHIIGYSVVTGKERKWLDINRELKKHASFFSIFGGPHPTFNPQVLNDKWLDGICIGEGEGPITELAEAIAHGSDITKIKNIWMKTKNGIVKNKLRPLVEDLDSLPFPDREIFQGVKEGRSYNIMSSRGCPYDCSYCINHQLHILYGDKKMRYRSIDNFFDELKFLKREYRARMFLIHDDLFILNKKRVLEFTRRYAKEIGVPFSCSARPEMMTKGIAEALSGAGCSVVFVGIESGNEGVRKKILNRRISDEQILNCCGILRTAGIKIIAQNILGIPATTIRNDFETLELNVRCKSFYAWCSICVPYQHTRIEIIAREVKQLPKDYPGCIGSSYHHKTFLNLPHASKVNVLHKVFSLAARYPAIIPAVHEIVNRADEADFLKLNRLALDYRQYVYGKMAGDMKVFPSAIKEFLKDPVTFSLQDAGNRCHPKVCIYH